MNNNESNNNDILKAFDERLNKIKESKFEFGKDVVGETAQAFDETLDILETQSKIEQLMDNIAIRQNVDNLRLQSSELTKNLGKNYDNINSDKVFLKDLPQEFNDIKNEFQELIDKGNLNDDELDIAKTLISQIEKTQSQLTNDDFTKNSLIFENFDKIAEKVVNKIHNLDENEDLLEKADQSNNTLFAKRKKEEDQLQEELEKEEALRRKREIYVDPTIDLENNKLLKMSQFFLGQHQELTEGNLKKKIAQADMRTMTSDQIIAGLRMPPYIYGSENAVRELFEEQKKMNKDKHMAKPLPLRMLSDLQNEFKASIEYAKQESKNNIVFSPLNPILNYRDNYATKRTERTHSLQKLSTGLAAKYLHSAGMLAGRANVLGQLVKNEVNNKIQDTVKGTKGQVVDKAESVSKLAKNMKEAVSDLGNQSIIGIRSILEDSKNGITSPIVKKSIDKSNQVKANIGNRLNDLFGSKQKDQVETPDIKPKKMTLNF